MWVRKSFGQSIVLLSNTGFWQAPLSVERTGRVYCDFVANNPDLNHRAVLAGHAMRLLAKGMGTMRADENDVSVFLANGENLFASFDEAGKLTECTIEPLRGA